MKIYDFPLMWAVGILLPLASVPKRRRGRGKHFQPGCKMKTNSCLIKDNFYWSMKSIYCYIDEFITTGNYYLKINRHVFVMGLKRGFIRGAWLEESILPMVLNSLSDLAISFHVKE